MTTASDLETWVREELRLEPAQSVDISELAGTDPRCSPIVTQVAVGPTPESAAPLSMAGSSAVVSMAGSSAVVFHIERPLDELVRMDLVAALAFGGGH